MLKSIKSYNDFLKISKKDYDKLSNEIRDYIIDLGKRKEIHYSSNLGIIETTIALLSSFNINQDLLIYDTGHQTYPHKILTGRFSKFESIREHNGIAGLLDMFESKYDHYSPGHCSNSLSVLQGFYLSEMNKNNKHYVCIVGDSAFSNGLFQEALNFVSHRKDPLIIVLNDNQMSISEAIGGLNKSFNKMGGNSKLLKNKLKLSARTLFKFNKFKCKNFFTSLGFYYIGKIDGHDINQLLNAFALAKKMSKNNIPTIVHINTKKGLGCNQAIEDKCGSYHSKVNSNITNSFGEVAANHLEKLLIDNNDIKIINPAMNIGSGFLNIYNNSFNNMLYHNKYFDVGINEEHAISMASGLAIKNKIVFALFYSTFLQRSYDQLLHDVARLNLKLNLLIDRADLAPGDGPTHHGIFDVSFLSTLPNTIISAPRNYKQLKELINLSLDPNLKKIFAIRYPRKYDIEYNETDFSVKLFEPEYVIQKKDSYKLIISYGPIVNKIAHKINNEKTDIDLINAIFINLLSEQSLLKIFKQYKTIFCYERIYGDCGLYKTLIDFKNKNNLTNQIFLISYKKIPYFGNLDLLDIEHQMDLNYFFDFIKRNS